MPITRSSHDLHKIRFAGKEALYVTATNRQSVGDDQNKVKRLHRAHQLTAEGKRTDTMETAKF